MNRLVLLTFLLVGGPAQAQTGVGSLQEIALKDGAAQLNLPIASEAIVAEKWPKELGDLNTFMTKSFEVHCAEKTYAAKITGTSYPVRSSEIEELASPGKAAGNSITTATACSAPAVQTNTSGFAQATGTFTVSIKSPDRMEWLADRRLYLLRIPFEKASSWGSFQSDADIYRTACNSGKDASTSTLFADCSEPAIEVSCCANASLKGELTALIYAYAVPSLKSETVTGKSVLEATALATQLLVKKSKSLGPDLAFSVCAPASWAYAPVMAYQSTCYTVEQKYVSRAPDLNRCQATVGDSKIWVQRKILDGKPLLLLSVLDPRFKQSTNDTGVFNATGTGGTLTTDKGAVLAIAGNAATLTKANVLIKTLPDTTVQLKCE